MPNKSTYFFNKYLARLVAQFIGLFLVLHIISCDCKPNSGNNTSGTTKKVPSGIQDTKDGSLLMGVSPILLVGTKKTTEVILKLANPYTSAKLQDFTLRVSCDKEMGQIDYKVYKNGVATQTYTSVVEEKLTHFVEVQELSPGQNPLKISFSLIPKSDILQATIKFEFFDKFGHLIKEGKVNWEEEIKRMNLELSPSPIDKFVVRGDEKIGLRITNREAYSTEDKRLKLKITRTGGSATQIQGAVHQGGNEYEMELGVIAGQGISELKLMILPGLDTRAKFSFQLVYGGRVVGEAVDIRWQKPLVDSRLNDIEKLLQENKFKEAVNKFIEIKATPTSDPLQTEEDEEAIRDSAKKIIEALDKKVEEYSKTRKIEISNHDAKPAIENAEKIANHSLQIAEIATRMGESDKSKTKFIDLKKLQVITDRSYKITLNILLDIANSIKEQAKIYCNSNNNHTKISDEYIKRLDEIVTKMLKISQGDLGKRNEAIKEVYTIITQVYVIQASYYKEKPIKDAALNSNTREAFNEAEKAAKILQELAGKNFISDQAPIIKAIQEAYAVAAQAWLKRAIYNQELLNDIKKRNLKFDDDNNRKPAVDAFNAAEEAAKIAQKIQKNFMSKATIDAVKEAYTVALDGYNMLNEYIKDRSLKQDLENRTKEIKEKIKKFSDQQ